MRVEVVKNIQNIRNTSKKYASLFQITNDTYVKKKVVCVSMCKIKRAYWEKPAN